MSALLRPVPFTATPDRAVRPKHCAMSSGKLENAIGKARTWAGALMDYLSRQNYPVGDLASGRDG